MDEPRDQAHRAGAGLRSPPPLHLMQAFEAVARNLSVAKAAGELRLSESALGQSIASLEDRLGLKLVRSLSPRVELTDAGEKYLRAVQTFAQRLRDGLHARSATGRAQLRVTATPAVSRLWLAPRLRTFAERHPRIDLVITSTGKFQSLKAGGVDIGLRYGGTIDEDLLVVPLWTDRLVAVGSPTLAREADGLSPAEMARTLPLVDHPVASWRQWLNAFDPSLGAVQPVLTCQDLHLALEAACQGMGVVIAPSRIVAAKVAAGQLRIASRHSAPGKSYQAVFCREQAPRPPLRAFVQWLGEQADADRGVPGASHS